MLLREVSSNPVSGFSLATVVETSSPLYLFIGVSAGASNPF